jgi:two-component system LytT family sensor kinase
MYKKQLYRIAFISSPLLALLALSPAFMLMNTHVSYLIFILSFLFSYATTLTIWSVNIIILSSVESYKNNYKWKQYLLSYLFVVLLSLLVLAILVINSIQKEPLQLIYNLVNILGINSIILIISNTITLQYKNAQTEKELTNLKIQNLEDEQQQLIKQLQPHFLFNALSTLKYLIKTDAELAEEYLIKLSEFLRFSISSHKNKVVPLSEELQFTFNYIEMQHIRFTGSFTCSIDITEEEIPKYILPIYALQTLVENAIKHNAFTEETPLIVEIVFREGNLIVSNNKIPKFIENKGGVGLQNLSKRYMLFCGKEIQINETIDRFEVIIKLIKKNSVC